MVTAKVLIVAGGGSGGRDYGGGGGAGGLLYNAAHTVTAKEYTVTVGAGGIYGTSAGGNSVFDGVTADGGANGVAYATNGASGGSGSGGSGGNTTTNTDGGTATQGNSGGFTGFGYAGGGGIGSVANSADVIACFSINIFPSRYPSEYPCLYLGLSIIDGRLFVAVFSVVVVICLFVRN